MHHGGIGERQEHAFQALHAHLRASFGRDLRDCGGRRAFVDRAGKGIVCIRAPREFFIFGHDTGKSCFLFGRRKRSDFGRAGTSGIKSGVCGICFRASRGLGHSVEGAWRRVVRGTAPTFGGSAGPAVRASDIAFGRSDERSRRRNGEETSRKYPKGEE